MTNQRFVLHPRLAADTHPVAELPLCDLRLMDDRRFPWLILIPRVPEARELHRLAAADQQQLLGESGAAAEILERLFRPDKLNVGALGNLVPQFHWHLVARNQSDPCWPGPVWGCGERQPYTPAEARKHTRAIASLLTKTELPSGH